MMVCSYYFLLLIKFLTCYRSLRKHEARR
jgi:hypothetical protein